jgi:hypothetical protein
VIVEDRRVEIAMIAFYDCLANDGKKCERPKLNQYNKPVEPAQVKGEPTLRILALDLAACTRSALKKDRNIEFGEVRPAETTCPYD